MSGPAALVDLRPLREQPTFRRLWLGSTASGFGSQLGAFAATYYVWDRTHDPLMVGLVGLCTAAPMIAFALLGSAFVDHVDRRRLALATTCGLIVTSLLMTAVAAWPTDAVWAMFGLVAVASALSALGGPARRAFTPRLLPADRLAAGLALNHLSFQLALLLGPAVAGLLTARWGTTVCFGIDAVTFVAALIGLAGLPRTGPAERAGRAGAGAAWEGIRFAARTPVVRGAFLVDLAATVLAMPVAVFPVINQEKFGGSPQTLGLLTSALAVGGVLASALSGLVTRRDRPGLVLLGCAAVWGAALAGVGLSDRLPVVLGLIALAGAADTWSVVSRGTIVQSSTPESHRGRIAALEHIVGSAGPHVGGLRAGLVAAGSSGGTALFLGGLTCLAGVGLLALTAPLRRFTMPRPAPTPAEVTV
ncbi:MFS transporter [Micromonospora auratinigra]|uniref:Predicted arabinose efflux permease, MFS family n=1 Tax=Micromonospora auratinigra TaxID=261654 RepID=A0A1A9A067_9ACTN|nr:MFS transporter [Micromonospora auratinigra]SBT49803.1 Predicted arabinose efflux permease, MFS family [Micromonospora auratinigra]